MQQGATEEAFEARRISVVRGQVITRDGDPLPGVTVTIKDHPEFGWTQSRNDGWYDLAVNGGGYLVLEFNLDGWLPAQRPTQVPWNDFAIAETAALIQLDQTVTTIDLTDATEPFQAAQGSPVTDEDGTRRATVLFPQGVTATMTLADGTQQTLTTINFRATEYTVGPNGPQAMPAPLPPASGYTYAVELSADEVIQAGAKRIDFDRVLPFYVDNFLNFPVGEIVPVGWYDYDKAAWIPSDNGRVIEILRIDNGQAVLSVSREGGEATSQELDELGITEEELIKLAGIYSEGQSLWRSPVTHFSLWDCNCPYGTPDGSTSPNPKVARNGDQDSPDEDCHRGGCVLNAESQVLGEDIVLTGVPFSLHYRSDRTLGRKTGKSLSIPLIGEEVPPPLEAIELNVTVEGQVNKFTFPASASQKHDFVWDGLDAYGRKVQGGARARIDISYVYSGVYMASSADILQSFAQFADVDDNGTTRIIADRRTLKIKPTKTRSMEIGSFDSSKLGLGAWTLSVHHFYDPVKKILYTGDGERRSARSIGQNVVETVAGCDWNGGDGFEVPATEAYLRNPSGICFGPKGDMYIAESQGGRVSRISPDGIRYNFAGLGPWDTGFSGDGGPAVEARIYNAVDVAVGPDGSVFICDSEHRIRKVDANGIITTVAGIGEYGYNGDGGLATETMLHSPQGIAVGADGSLFIADFNNRRIRKVSPVGIITTVAGDGDPWGDRSDGIPALIANIAPQKLAIGKDGSIYFTDGHRIRKIDPFGIITTVAGTGDRGYSGDGGPAVLAELYNPKGLTITDDGNIYVADCYNHVVRRIDILGIITTVAGNPSGRF